VLGAAELLLRRLETIRGAGPAGLRIRLHGDYHLGQVLRTEEDFVILDFEGEPGRTLAERRAKQSPLKDVAGMMRSFSYAAYAALFTFTLNAPTDFAAMALWADTWQRWVGEAFLSGYREAIGRELVATDHPLFQDILSAYELNNRPDWVRIPLAGIMTTL
jgi:maltose alpha-D-glucosyltransferase / alpha-amylase